MEATSGIDRNHEALQRILATLVAMAGLAGGAKTLPRHLYLAVLRLLRPAESAARRLIIAAAHGIAVTLPPPRPRKPEPPKPDFAAYRRLGLAIVLSPAQIAAEAKAAKERAARAARPARTIFQLVDPPRRPFRRRYPRRTGTPRIGWGERPKTPPPPSANDPVDATRLGQRLEALASVLGDLPGQARRFARWQAMRERARAEGRRYRFSPLRSGRPPGGRLSRYDPAARVGCNIREIDQILAHCHALADYALAYPDTS